MKNKNEISLKIYSNMKRIHFYFLFMSDFENALSYNEEGSLFFMGLLTLSLN